MSHHRAPRRGAARRRPSPSRPDPRAAWAAAALAPPPSPSRSPSGRPAPAPRRRARAAVAAAGAPTAAPAGPSGALDGTDAVGYAVGSRGHVVSRDSERQALSDVAGAEVQPATEDKGARPTRP